MEANRWNDDGSVLSTCPDCGGRAVGSENDGRCDRCAGIPTQPRTQLEILEAQARTWQTAVDKTLYESNRQVYRRRLDEVRAEISRLKGEDDTNLHPIFAEIFRSFGA